MARKRQDAESGAQYDERTVAIIDAAIDKMIEQGLIEQLPDGRLQLTEAGRLAADEMRKGE